MTVTETSHTPESTLTALVDELRSIGVGISVGEHLDAARALASVPLASTEVVRSTLQCALVKRAEHLDAFNLLFDLHFAGTGPAEPGALAHLSADDLAAALRAAIESRDPPQLRQLAEEYVRRYAALEPGAPVAGVFAMIAASDAANLGAIRDSLLAAGEGAGDGDSGGGAGGTGGGGWQSGGGAIRDRLDRAAADRAVDRFRAELQAAIRRALVTDRGARAVTKTMRVRLAEDVDIATASAAEQEALLSSIGPL